MEVRPGRPVDHVDGQLAGGGRAEQALESHERGNRGRFERFSGWLQTLIE